MRAYAEVEGYRAIEKSVQLKGYIGTIHNSQVDDDNESNDQYSCSSPKSSFSDEEGYCDVPLEVPARDDYEKHIEFDLAGLPHTKISKSYLERLSKHLDFETMLKYVALPRLTVEDMHPVRKQNQRRQLQHRLGGASSDIHSEQYSNQKKGAEDMKTVFDWLRGKGVKVIVKVMVIDDGDTPHSDRAIEESLEEFQVENWDWKKLDISSEVISRSTTKVEEVSLYCSGNNAVLMGWGSSYGFPNKAKFPQLKRLNLFIRQGLEDCDYLQRYIDDFKKSIEECERIRLSYRIDDNLISYASDFQTSVEQLQHEHEWISHMKSFRTFLKNIEAGRSLQVKVAIIDDCVDASLDILGPNVIASGMTFCPHQNSDFLVNPYFAPSGKHSTQMATLIAKVCPNVRLYIARLNESTIFDRGRRQITAKSAAEAVNWAVECGVDIISMSWTIEGENESIPELEAAIMNAERKDIVMFCSASDQGHNSNAQSCYPGSWMKCIRIGAATSTGEKVTWVPDFQYDFLFPGKNIPFMDNEGKVQSYESGSSLATALAAGLAGTLLFCSRLLIHIEMVDQDDSAYLRGKHKMQKAFGKMCQGTNSKWPLVDQYFGSGFKRMLSNNALTENGKAIHSGVSIDEFSWDTISQKTLFDLLKSLIGDRMKLRKN
ncbi:subtilisin-like protein [Corynespora cassiicola Philippines]|uniref:Subtilisin-like protein n=1 Tax=Corynespora cassiicola Philippines TaxID=1448308 RepID=A0A2T2N3I0_CORCC|nr:subtilisin-like protein [Corynespora cassiicola Philippines]